jgi:hypothetical protein
VIIPGKTACFSCTLALFPQQQGFQLCTIADTPRQPEHCIAYAQLLQWPAEFPDTTLDADVPEHVTWVLNKAQERAQKFNISGVTYRSVGQSVGVYSAVCLSVPVPRQASRSESVCALTWPGLVLVLVVGMQADAGRDQEHHPRGGVDQRHHCGRVVQRGHQAAHGALAVHEQLHDVPGGPRMLVLCTLVTRGSIGICVCLQGPEGVYTFTTAHERREDCLVCGTTEVVVRAHPSRLLKDFIGELKANPQLQLAAPSITTDSATLYMQKPPSLEAATRANLDRPLKELMADGDVLSITDPTVQGSVTVVVKLEG